MKQIVSGFHKNFKSIPEKKEKIEVKKLNVSKEKEVNPFG